MKLTSIRAILVALSLAASAALSQEPKAPTASNPPKLSADEVAKVKAILAEVQKLTVEKHYFDALKKVDEADAMVPNSAVIWNVRGSVYTAFREFDKAREAFTKAREAMPQAFEPQFNLTELLYVEQHYSEAREAFQKLLKDFPKLRETVRHLVLFKILVCMLKEGDAAGAQEIQKNFTSMDDTPAYFYSKAAVAYSQGNPTEATSWLEKAERIFKKEQNAVYIDALGEARWYPSFEVPQIPSEKNKGEAPPKSP